MAFVTLEPENATDKSTWHENPIAKINGLVKPQGEPNTWMLRLSEKSNDVFCVADGVGKVLEGTFATTTEAIDTIPTEAPAGGATPIPVELT